MQESTKGIKTEDAVKMLGIDRPRLIYVSLGLGIKPRQEIIKGRAHNFYTSDQLKKIEEVLNKAK